MLRKRSLKWLSWLWSLACVTASASAVIGHFAATPIPWIHLWAAAAWALLAGVGYVVAMSEVWDEPEDDVGGHSG